MSARTPSLREALKRELEALERLGAPVRGSVDAALAHTLVSAITDPETSPRDATAAARGLTEVMDRLRATAPAEQATDRLDELAAARQRRRAS